MKRVLLQPAYVLHRRPYRESSFLVDLFTADYGRLTVVANGARKAKSSTQGILQPFIPLLVSWSGRSELVTLISAETNGAVSRLHGECLFAGFYLNELLVALMQKWDAHPNLYQMYGRTLTALRATQLEQKTLRSFEKYLLEELGYGLLPKSPVSLHNTFLPDKYYRFVPEHGFILHDSGEFSKEDSCLFSGKSLLAIAEEDWQEKTSLHDAKRLIRFVLAPLLGARPIYSRQLFIKPEEKQDE